MFTGVWALGIAPPWFALVGFLAARPFARLFSHFYRFDRGAAMMLAVLGVGVGSAGAFAWKQFAFDLFSTFPSLIPSAYPHHGLAILGIVAAFAVGRRFVPPLPAIAAETTAASEETVTTRIAEPTTHVRVAGAEGAALTERAEEEAALAELDSELQGRAARR